MVGILIAQAIKGSQNKGTSHEPWEALCYIYTNTWKHYLAKFLERL